METRSYNNRWFLAVNGLIAILFGLLLLFFPEKTFIRVVFYSGLAIAAGGLCFLFIALYYLKKERRVGMLILQAIFSLSIGLGIILFPDNSLHMFFLLLGIWAIIVGVFQLVILVNVKRNLTNKNFILFNGLLTIALGIVLILQKQDVPYYLPKLLGVFATLIGIVMIYLSIIIRKTANLTENESDPPSK